MESFFNFLRHYYFIFIIVAVLLVFALIGYFVENNRRKSKVYKLEKEKEDLSDLNIDKNLSLNDVVNKNYNMNSGISMDTTEKKNSEEKL